MTWRLTLIYPRLARWPGVIVLKFTPRSPRWHAKRIARGGIVWVLAASNTALPFRHAVRRQDVRRLHHRRHHRRRRRRCRPSSLGRLTGQQCGSPPLHPVDRNRTKYSPLLSLSLSLLSILAAPRIPCSHIHDLRSVYRRTRTRSIWYSSARANAKREPVCAQKNHQGVFCERDTQTRARACLCRWRTHVRYTICVGTPISRGHAAPQELVQFRKATTMIAPCKATGCMR